MPKYKHEIRDPVHAFIKVTEKERDVVNSSPVQRLREIHQLALTHLLYPGATHRRFEHSLGVMELADRAYQVVTNPENVTDEVRKLVRDIGDSEESGNWRKLLRMAALLHDVGHLPFSHVGEEGDLLPPGWNHEFFTFLLIHQPDLSDPLKAMGLSPTRVAKIAVGESKVAKIKKNAPGLVLPADPVDLEFSDWERILSELIVGDFGADRMDYLLRDSLHAGVAYGTFDYHRLIDCLRALPLHGEDGSGARPKLGVQEGGLHSVEALIVARYFMFSQVYFHPVRQAYDHHLRDYLFNEILKGQQFPVDPAYHQSLTDTGLWAALLESGSDTARRIAKRGHFKEICRLIPGQRGVGETLSREVFGQACAKYGADNVRLSQNPSKRGIKPFPVLRRRREDTVSSHDLSPLLAQPPTTGIHYVFVHPDLLDKAVQWFSETFESKKGQTS